MHMVFSFEFLKIFHNSFFVKIKPITIIQIRAKQTLETIFSGIQGMSKDSSYFFEPSPFPANVQKQPPEISQDNTCVGVSFQ